MKTSVIVRAGLLAAAALALSAMGCKINHYGTGAAPVDPGGEERCRATCDQLVEDEVIPRGSMKECQAACRTPASASPVKPADARVAENACPQRVEARADASPADRPDASCPCKKGTHCGHCRAPAPPAPPAPACQSDFDCPEDAACQSGTCR